MPATACPFRQQPALTATASEGFMTLSMMPYSTAWSGVKYLQMQERRLQNQHKQGGSRAWPMPKLQS